MQELWHPVAGYEGLYEVSSLGRVRSLDRITRQRSRSGRYVDVRYRGKMLKLAVDKKGYRFVCLAKEGISKNFMVHTLVLEAFVGPRQPGLVCRHGTAGNGCNDLSNLSYGTYKDNIHDKYRDGTMGIGTKNGRAVLTEEIVLWARSQSHMTVAELARKFDVGWTTMNSALKGETWSHLPHGKIGSSGSVTV